MPDRLATIPAAVKHASIAALGNAKALRQIPRRDMHVPQQLGVHWLDIQHAGDVLTRNDQHVCRRLGMDVTEGDDMVILMQDVGFHAAGGNFAE